MSSLTPFVPPPATHWPSSNFVLAAGTATYQPSTRKVLIIQDTARTLPGTPRQSCIWFLPRGRKDIGETIEACAIRETLEEAGYAANLLLASHPTRQPTGATPSAATAHTEAFHLQLLPHISRRYTPLPRELSDICLYAAFWYLCTLPADAARVPDYGAHFVGRHEQGYNSELVDVDEAVALLSAGRFEYRESEGRVLERETGREVRWGEVKAGFDGGVEALIVAGGWEVVKRTVEGEWVDEEEKKGR